MDPNFYKDSGKLLRGALRQGHKIGSLLTANGRLEAERDHLKERLTQAYAIRSSGGHKMGFFTRKSITLSPDQIAVLYAQASEALTSEQMSALYREVIIGLGYH
jgi:regulator of replication initiation timing